MYNTIQNWQRSLQVQVSRYCSSEKAPKNKQKCERRCHRRRYNSHLHKYCAELGCTVCHGRCHGQCLAECSPKHYIPDVELEHDCKSHCKYSGCQYAKEFGSCLCQANVFFQLKKRHSDTFHSTLLAEWPYNGPLFCFELVLEGSSSEIMFRAVRQEGKLYVAHFRDRIQGQL